ncbi:MAG: GH109, partial [uncultured Thermomicrobiales bacterium]
GRFGRSRRVGGAGSGRHHRGRARGVAPPGRHPRPAGRVPGGRRLHPPTGAGRRGRARNADPNAHQRLPRRLPRPRHRSGDRRHPPPPPPRDGDRRPGSRQARPLREADGAQPGRGTRHAADRRPRRRRRDGQLRAPLPAAAPADQDADRRGVPRRAARGYGRRPPRQPERSPRPPLGLADGAGQGGGHARRLGRPLRRQPALVVRRGQGRHRGARHPRPPAPSGGRTRHGEGRRRRQRRPHPPLRRRRPRHDPRLRHRGGGRRGGGPGFGIAGCAARPQQRPLRRAGGRDRAAGAARSGRNRRLPRLRPPVGRPDRAPPPGLGGGDPDRPDRLAFVRRRRQGPGNPRRRRPLQPAGAVDRHQRPAVADRVL